MRQTKDPQEDLEVFGDELRTVIADDARLGTGSFFQRLLQHHFNISLFHFLTDVPVNNRTTEAIEY